ncbi:unnamed protein product [Danaus chrysippus]|uniref:(African queen) hypothetical protein n=1 Tax=Danaus chrysippus TaxID=151541 RepID=A0A8J2VYG9_9NEOP|nr:unnamed protein product [Danaus chrysippus]
MKCEVALGRSGSTAGGAQTLTFKYSSNLANRRNPGSIRRSSLQTGRRARLGNSGLVSCVIGAGVVPGGWRIGAPPPVWSRGCGATAALHVTVRRARS